MSNTVERFSNRVENYVKYRPGYPLEVLQAFRDEMNLTEDSVIADIGSGTGISAKVFLENGNTVFGIEPNAAMRDAAETFLKGFSKFNSVDGTAENTTLNDDSVDFVTAAQAFHWFDPAKTRAEFSRIVRAKGYVVLIWNERLLDANDFLRNYEKLLINYGSDYEKVRHDNIDPHKLKEFFKTIFRRKLFETFKRLILMDLKAG